MEGSRGVRAAGLSDAWRVSIRIRNDNELILWGWEALTISQLAGRPRWVLDEAQPQAP